MANSMISAWWLIAAFFGGVAFGAFMLAIVSADRGD
jgi:hypothetical protein